jgi:hypothetical protein
VDLHIVVKWILQNDLVDNISSWHLHKLGLVALHMTRPFSLPRELKLRPTKAIRKPLGLR